MANVPIQTIDKESDRSQKIGVPHEQRRTVEENLFFPSNSGTNKNLYRLPPFRLNPGFYPH